MSDQVSATRPEDWADWRAFKDAQKSLVLPAGSVVHTDVSIRYIDHGEDLNGTVLLMHGIPTWGFLYHQIIPVLLKAGYRVIAPDFLGHGWSDRRDCFDRCFQTQARMIVALLNALKIDRSHIVGHDTGGAVALILAIEHAHLADKIVISNSVCYDRFDDDMLDFGHPMRWKPKPIEELTDALEESLRMGLSNPDRLTAEFREGIIAPWASEEGKLSLLRNASALNANQTMALVDRHEKITRPVMLIWGMNDPWQKAEDGQQLAKEIPGAVFKPIENGSHWIPQDCPEVFANEIVGFFDRGQ